MTFSNLHSIVELDHIHFVNNAMVFLLPLALMGLDILTGLAKAWNFEDFKSKKMRSGLTKKIGEIAILVIGELFQYSLSLPTYIMTCISIYIVFMELMSNVENLNAIGVPLPAFLTKVLRQVDDSLQKDDIKEIAEKLEQLKTGE